MNVDRCRNIVRQDLLAALETLALIPPQEKSEEELESEQKLTEIACRLQNPVSEDDLRDLLPKVTDLSLHVDSPHLTDEFTWSAGSSPTSSVHDLDVFRFREVVEGPVKGKHGGFFFLVRAKKTGRVHKRYISRASALELSPAEKELLPELPE
eukprot:EC792101.1.p1 GENE.EC792101.1~~EC792101.1.p1  ORF type:complete len:153 (+),score=24.57 EC792101.1:60-518(+)